jgi:hypothetical protein
MGTACPPRTAATLPTDGLELYGGLADAPQGLCHCLPISAFAAGRFEQQRKIHSDAAHLGIPGALLLFSAPEMEAHADPPALTRFGK